MGKIELLCLGTGDAEAALYDNIACASYAVLLDGYPVLLVGAGPGALRAVTHYAQLVPECVLLLSASLEQLHEISALVACETQARRQIRIFAPKDVCAVLGELLRIQLLEYDIAPETIALVSLPVCAPGGENECFSLVHDFSVMLHVGSGAAAAAGRAAGGGTPAASSALLCFRDQAIIAFSGPVPFDALLYAKLCQAPFVVVWAAQQSTARRASIYDVAAFSDKVNTMRRQEERVVFLVGGYGLPHDAPLLAGYVVLLHQGSPVVVVASEVIQSPFSALHLPLLNVRKAVPMKYPLNGKTTVLPNDVGGGNDVPTAMGHQRGGGGAGAMLSPRNSAAVLRHTPLTAAALQQTASFKLNTSGAGGGHASSVDSGPTPRGGGGGGGAHYDPAVMARWMDPAHGGGGLGGLGDGGDRTGSGRGGGTGGSYDTRKVYVYTNEDKGAPGKLLLLRNFRNLFQLAQRVAQMFSLKPIKDFHHIHGAVVRNLDHLQDGCELIAVRRGGAPYNPQDLPRLLKSKR